MICTWEHGSVSMKSLFLTATKIDPTFLLHLKFSDAAKEMRTNPGTKLEKCGKMFRHAYKVGDGMDMDHYV